MQLYLVRLCHRVLWSATTYIQWSTVDSGQVWCISVLRHLLCSATYYYATVYLYSTTPHCTTPPYPALYNTVSLPPLLIKPFLLPLPGLWKNQELVDSQCRAVGRALRGGPAPRWFWSWYLLSHQSGAPGLGLLSFLGLGSSCSLIPWFWLSGTGTARLAKLGGPVRTLRTPRTCEGGGGYPLICIIVHV